MSQDPTSSCLTCRKRQVKCDGDRPTCTRCPKDDRVCRGYKDQMRIVQVHPTKKPQSLASKKQKAVPHESQYHATSLPQHIFVSERDLWSIIDCAEYWNRHVIPETFPIERPFFRVFIKGEDINSQPLPKVCLHVVILTFRSTQAAKLLIDPRSQSDLCYYRGLALKGLPEHLETAATDPRGIALLTVVVFLAAELLQPDGSWLAHLDAARRIILMRGGMAACRCNLPDSEFILVQWLIIETFTSTVSSSAALPPVSYSDLIGDLGNFDFHLITCATACPQHVIKAILRISCLRRRLFDEANSSVSSDQVSSIQDYQTLRSDLQSFNCHEWAGKMPTLGFAYPIEEAQVAPCSSIDGLISTAECFRSAALVYLLLSCNVDDDCAVSEAKYAGASLNRELDRLFDAASSNCDDPLDTQLWKFATWPLSIAAYALAGWDIGAPETELKTLYARMNRIAAVKGTWARSTAEECMEKVEARRAKYPEIKWKWDMGFPSRQAFVL